MRNVNCVAEAELRAFQRGEVPDSVATLITGHLETCPDCAALADRLDAEVEPCVVHLRAAVAGPAAERTTVVDARGTARPTGGGPETVTAENNSSVQPVAESFPRPFGGYELVSELGRGGMGVVYLARQRWPARTVALKVILAGVHAGSERRARFLAEADVIGRLQHPHIVQIYEAGEHDGQLWLSLEYVAGGSLARCLSGRPQDPAASAALLQKLARAIHYAHESGVVHRDLKPANILLQRAEDRGQRTEDKGQRAEDGAKRDRLSSVLCPKITDFGLAKQDEVQLTASSVMLGTPAYMAPEQAAGDNRRVGPPADVYALGAILYEMLTGRPPFRGNGALDILEQVRTREPLPPRQRQARVPLDLSTICLKCLHKEPDRRYASALELAEDLGRFLAGEPIRARPVRAPERLWRWTRRNPAWAAVLTALALLLLAGTAVSAWQAVRATNAEEEAHEAARLARVDRDKAVQAEADAKLQRDQAVAARHQAEEEKSRADEEAAFARDVSMFLRRDLLALASPMVHADLHHSPDKDVKLRTVLDKAAGQIAGRFPGRPLVEAAIRTTIGLAYLDLGEWDVAQLHLEAAHAIYLQKLGSDHIDTVKAEGNLAVLYSNHGQFTRAEQLGERVVLARQKLVGADHPDTLHARINLAVVYIKQGRYARAEPLCLALVEACRQHLGADHPHTLTCRNNLAALYQAQGRYDKAEPLHLETLEAQQRLEGVDHPVTLMCQNNLAALYANQGRYDKAEALFLKTVEAQRHSLGDDHPHTLATQHNLAEMYVTQGRYDKAEPLCLAALEMQRLKHGADHPDTWLFQNNLARLYFMQGKRAAAEKLYLQTLERQRLKLGADHPRTLQTQDNLAWVYYVQGDFARAEPLYVNVLDLRRNKLGADHPDTLSSQHNLALLYKSQRQCAKAELLYAQCLGGRQKLLGAVHPDTLTTQNNLAVLYQARGEYARAEPLGVATLQARLENLGADHPDTLTSQNTLAVLYQLQGRYAEAEALFQKTLEGRRQKLGADHPNTLTSQHNLAACYLDQGKCAKAEVLLAGMVEMCRQKLGEKHSLTQNVKMRLKVLPQLKSAGERYQEALAVHGAAHTDTLGARLQWAAALAQQGQPGVAEHHVLAVVAVRQGLLGDDHLDTLRALHQLAWLQRPLGKPAEAAALERKVVDTAVRVQGEGDPFTQQIAGDALKLYKVLGSQGPEVADVEALLGRRLLADNQHAAAEPLLRDCLRIREQQLPGDWTTFEAQILLGAALLGQQKHAEAEAHLLAGHDGLRQRASQMPRRWRLVRLSEAVESLICLYVATGQQDKADEWRRKQRRP
jgi:tetratricopeptide (TPR) repeat protein